MPDKWVAECLPCKWQTDHDSEQEALHAAESHVDNDHRGSSPVDRATRKIGHVQLRTLAESDEATKVPAGGHSEPSPHKGDKPEETGSPAGHSHAEHESHPTKDKAGK